MPVTYDFQNRVAIVTGGTRGIGRSIAERLRDAGAQVFVWDLHAPDFDGVSFAEVDVSVASSIERAFLSSPRKARRSIFWSTMLASSALPRLSLNLIHANGGVASKSIW